MFCYNCKTGNILIHDKYVLRFEDNSDGIRFWYKDKKCKMYLCNTELLELRKFLFWMIERGSDFGEGINSFVQSFTL